MPINTKDTYDDQDMFSRSFWGENIKDGIKILSGRLLLGEVTTKNMIKFMDQFEKLEEEYSNGLRVLSTSRLYKDEYPSVKRALNEVIEQTISMSKTHAKFCSEIKILATKRLKECLAREHSVRKEQKELVSNQIRLTLKAYKRVAKAKEVYFSNCKLKEVLLSQKPSPMSKSFDVHEEKLQKIMKISQDDEQTYINAIRYARAEHATWVDVMKTACIECQRVEQERIDAISNSMKNLAIGLYNSRTTDISSSEAIRRTMTCDPCDDNSIIKSKQDFSSFCDSLGTGRVIPEPPEYINYYTMSPMLIPSFMSSSNNFSKTELSSSECTIRPPSLPESQCIVSSPDIMDQLFSVRVLYNYKSRQPEELDLSKGQVIVVTSLREDPWWIGHELEHPDRIGAFPSNYVSKIFGPEDTNK